MFRQLLVGFAASFTCIAVHSLIMVAVLSAARWASHLPIHRERGRLLAVMIAAVSVLMLAHLSEAFIWALTYELVAATPADANNVYFAFVNYTTLGYGDVLPEPKWRLLGPFTAMNGVLLFGWSTAVLFEILRANSRMEFAPDA